MNYSAELKKFVTSQYVYSGVRIALAIVIPSLILAYFGLLKEYFLFPLATSFVGLTDQPGPFIRRRNALILAIICFITVAAIASVLKDFPPLIFLEIIVFGMFFSMIGVYGQRLAAVGGLTLVVFSIFIDGHLTGANILKSLLIFSAGCIWFLLIFFVVTKLQPYKLAGQMIGENYLELADYLRIKAKFYLKNPDFGGLYQEVIAKQVVIKNLQEETREMVFKTRTIVNESTTTSRILMLMFLNSIDLYEKLMTSDQDYNKIHESFDNSEVLEKIHHYLVILAEEITNIGIALQGNIKTKSIYNIEAEHQKIYDVYFEVRNREMSADTLESFMALRMILVRINEITEDVKTNYKVLAQDKKLAKSLSTGLDYDKFVPKQEKLNSKVFLNNFSLKSSHFRHAVRITVALLLGYAFSKLHFLGIGHSYWILITIIAIMRPAYSTTKHRNLLRLYGTFAGAVIAYLLLTFVHNNTVLLFIMLSSMILCFALLKGKYSWAVFFMTIYIFIAFNFMSPGNVNGIFKDRIIDTAIAGIIAFLVAYFVLPVWEHTQNRNLMKASAKANLSYFDEVINRFEDPGNQSETYKIKRKDAIISMANLSDNFQRMLSDPKNQQRKMETVHQFVNTAHLITAYTASLSQYSNSGNQFPEIDMESWDRKISAELSRTKALLAEETFDENIKHESKIKPEDAVEELLLKRKTEIEENEFFDIRDPQRLTKLTELKNIREILELLYDVAREQRKVTENYVKIV
ncbi:FUSC family membrane protein [uncultured Chryseobacterium sp.]|uniref:FUSC family protein n=1 Tax=uncultured Chryseobacterium sp. TaxID=259322 RepID=UPI00261EC60D|nr:FUSC family membrane protein [uncultured Chryseobacterium sp.]